MRRTELKGVRAVVAGLGRSGVAAARLLVRRGARVTATDVKPLEQLPGAAEELAALGVAFERQSADVFAGAELVVLSPGVPADLPELQAAREKGVKIIGEVELAGWFLEGPVIGITGSNGKTTTTALVGHILGECGVPAQVGGNIGFPPTAMVEASRPEQWNVLELSSFQLETTETFRAQVAAVLNVTPDHLDRHRTMAAYAAAKRRLLETQQPGDTAILNRDDAVCRDFAAAVKGSVRWFSSTGRLESGLWLEEGWIVVDGGRFLPVEDVPLRGRHNLENVMAAAAAAQAAGAGLETIAAAVRTFAGVEHRLEYVRTVVGVDWFNDSKATNVDAALKAVDAFAGPLLIILGGKDKGGDYRPLREALRGKARAALLIGAAAGKIEAALEGAVETICCGTLEAAVEEARRRARPGDTVLLAPACASFDQFESFEHRGRVFKELVGRLREKPREEAKNCA